MRVASSACAWYLPAAMAGNLLWPGRRVAGWHHAQVGWGPALQRGPLAPMEKQTEESVKKRGWKKVSDKSPPTVAAHIRRMGQFAFTNHSLGLFALNRSLPGEMSPPRVPFCS